MEEQPRYRDERAPAGEEVEERIERLTDEIGKLIDGAPPETRRELADFGIGVLRGRLDEIRTDPRPGLDVAAPRSFNTLGLAIPLCLVGGLLLFLFPPVGMILLLVAGAMLVWGLVAGLLFRGPWTPS